MADRISTEFEMQVPFYDVDTFRIVWHGNYPKYFEIARCQLLDLIGFPYSRMEETGYFYPVIDLQVKYAQPIVFEQKIKVSATLRHWVDKLIVDYQIHDVESGDRLTKAQTTQVAVKMPGHITQFQDPQAFIDQVESALEKLSEHDQ